MTRRRSVQSLIHRAGKEADVLERQTTGTDEFNNPQSDWTQTGTVQCVRTYPNRNTQIDERGGSYERDHPVFIFPPDDEPPSDGRIRYNGQIYELESPTVYDSHVAIFGSRIRE